MDTITKNTINEALLNKELTALEFYSLNEKYWTFDEDHIWVIDGGIEFTFGDQSFSFGWNYEKGFYEHHAGKIATLTEDLKVKALHAENIDGVKELIGKKIVHTEITLNWYSDLDDNFEPTDVKHYMPMGITLQFDNGSVLQLAAVKYEIDTDTRKMDDITYDSEGELLITLNHVLKVEIESTDNE